MSLQKLPEYEKVGNGRIVFRHNTVFKMMKSILKANTKLYHIQLAGSKYKGWFLSGYSKGPVYFSKDSHYKNEQFSLEKSKEEKGGFLIKSHFTKKYLTICCPNCKARLQNRISKRSSKGKSCAQTWKLEAALCPTVKYVAV